ncbi:hypothetical protein F7725_009198 [Dissostichus mawsoni]|uniref:Solute carrier family 15 member 1 n=1 Tax=Dissostichus mawsoni TaxID=36200 RepID=A0A7J5Z8C5_DISMA|nr:hypothetical protein F7725_009198 [Dissostichus mawsoni]
MLVVGIMDVAFSRRRDPESTHTAAMEDNDETKKPKQKTVTVLVLYFKYFLKWDDDFATTIYHTFVALCYLTPILGAIVADSWLGKFKALSMVGLMLIALGTGGIKPCVAAFGGDQFLDHQEKQRSTFFSIFYLSINAGSLLSTIITPILRAQECGIYTKQSCYPLAFGVPAALMVVALDPPQGNIMVKVCTCIGFAIKNRFRHRSSQYPKREHWMDWSDEKYDKLLIAQVKMVLKGILTIQPDQMQTVNPILILIMVPIMDSVIYPLIAKCKLNFTTESQLKYINMMSTPLDVKAGNNHFTLKAFTANEDYLTFGSPFTLLLGSNVSYPIAVEKGNRSTSVIVQEGTLPKLITFSDITSKPEQGANAIRFFNGFNITLNITWSDQSFGNIPTNDIAQYQIENALGVCDYKQELGFGSSYTIVIPPTFNFESTCEQVLIPVVDIKPNIIHMAWQIPQYFLMTVGEVVFSVTGLEFAYSQAPSNMKSVLQAGWLLTVAVGNIIVLIIAEAATLKDQWAEYILFASLLVLVCFKFSIMAYFYTYIDPAKIEAEFAHKEPEEKKRKSVEMSRKDSVEQRSEGRKSSHSRSEKDEETLQTKI